MLSKLFFLIVALAFSAASFASESEELVSKTKMGFRTKVDSYLKINKQDRLYALIATKKSRRGGNGCATHQRINSTRKCRVLSERIRIKSLSVSQNNDIIFNNGTRNVNCGYIKDTWLGDKIVLNENCKLVSYEEVIEEDDGLDIRKVKYAVTKFLVKE